MFNKFRIIKNFKKYKVINHCKYQVCCLTMTTHQIKLPHLITLMTLLIIKVIIIKKVNHLMKSRNLMMQMIISLASSQRRFKIKLRYLNSQQFKKLMKYKKSIKLHSKLCAILKINNQHIRKIKRQKLMIYMISLFIQNDIII